MRPPVAKTEATRCNAFGKRDKRRCRLERCPGSLTCCVHRRYYETWLETHSLFGRQYMSKREIEEIEFQIQRNYVTVPNVWIMHLSPINYGDVEWYTFLIDHTCISPMKNTSCFEKVVYDRLFYNPMWKNEKALEVFTHDASSCQFVFRMILHWCITMSQGGFFSFVDLLAYYLEKLNWKPLLYSTVYIEEIQALMPTILETFSYQTDIADLTEEDNPLVRLLRFFQKKTATFVRSACEVYKEELMMTAWAPRRIQRWLDMGYDLDVLEWL